MMTFGGLKLVQLCGADRCCEEATSRASFSWDQRHPDFPRGAGERSLLLCAPCAVAAANIAAAMGLRLTLEPLTREASA
jgi:hypothetical protein